MGRTVDVVVIGGGPGGLSAARSAAKLGLEVLLFERKSRIGHPVRCGEFLPSLEVISEMFPNAENIHDIFQIPERVVSNKCHTVRVFSPRNKCFEFRLESFILDRPSFEQHLADLAVDSGVDVQVSCPASLKVQGDCVLASAKEDTFRGDVAIAADGFPSAASSVAGLPVREYVNRWNTALTIQYPMVNVRVDPDVVEMYFGSEIAPGAYAWVIPKDEHRANVGLGIRRSHTSENAKECLDRFVSRMDSGATRLSKGKVARVTGDVLPVGGPLRKTYSNRVVAVGDAACMLMPSNGGGIPTAMISGNIAGRRIARVVSGDGLISDYESAWKKQIGRELSVSTMLLRAADRLVGNDLAFGGMMTLLGSRGIRDVIMCRFPWLGGLLSRRRSQNE